MKEKLDGKVKWAKLRVLASLRGELPAEVEMELPVLCFDRRYLADSGFVVVGMLNEIERQESKRYGTYGPFLDIEGDRCQLLEEVVKAQEQRLLIYDWRLIEWLTT